MANNLWRTVAWAAFIMGAAGTYIRSCRSGGPEFDESPAREQEDTNMSCSAICGGPWDTAKIDATGRLVCRCRR